MPAFHVQAPCGDDIPCLITQFAATIQAEHAVDQALAACPAVRRMVRPEAHGG